MISTSTSREEIKLVKNIDEKVVVKINNIIIKECIWFLMDVMNKDQEYSSKLEDIEEPEPQYNHQEEKNEDIFQERPCENLVEIPSGEINMQHPVPEIFEQTPMDQEKLHIDLKEPEKNFFLTVIEKHNFILKDKFI